MESDVVIRLQGGGGAEESMELLARGGAPGCPLAGRGDARKPKLKSGRQDKTEPTDQFGLGCRGISYPQRGFKLSLDQTQVSPVQNLQRQLQQLFVYHHQPAQIDLAKLFEEPRSSTSLAKVSFARSQLATTTGRDMTPTR